MYMREIKMKKFISNLLVIVMSFQLVFYSFVGAESLNKGVIMLTPSGGKGFERFYPFLDDNIIKDHAYFPFGWSTVEREEGVYDWSEIDALIEEAKKRDKKFAVAFWAAGHSFEQAPFWLYEDYDMRIITSQGTFYSFERDDKINYELGNGAKLTDESEYVLAQSQSLLLEDGDFFKDRQSCKKASEYDYSIGIDYGCFSTGHLQVIAQMANGEIVTLWDAYIDEGEKQSKMMVLPKATDARYSSIEILVTGGVISIDNINIAPLIPGEQGAPVAFPNYMDERIKEKWDAFLKAVYDRYKDEDTMAAIYVGGYGRWDEPGICADFLSYDFEDPGLVDRQWLSYGYTDKKYLDYIKWCSDTTLKYFKDTNKDIIQQVIAFDVPGNPAYINWGLVNYVADKGIGIKVNGLSEKASEWNQDSAQFFWMAARERHSGLLIYHEQGGQINHPMKELSELMGHPLTHMNRLLIDSVDYFWMYQDDIKDIPNVRKYLHYANEQAGSILVNKMYSIMGKYPYFSLRAFRTFEHTNIWQGIFTKNGYELDYGDIDGVKYAMTNQTNKEIQISIDDRQKWLGMFGSTLSIDYYDEGNDSFEVSVMVPDKNKIRGIKKVLGVIEKTNTGTWKTVSFYDPEFTNDKRSGGLDMPVEIKINDLGDGREKISYVEINYVPVSDYMKYIIEEKTICNDEIAVLSDEKMILQIDANDRIDEISIPFTSLDLERPNASARVMAINAIGEETVVCEKDLYYPGKKTYLNLPVSNAPFDTVKFIVELSSDKQNVGVCLDEYNEVAYRILSFFIDDIDNENGVLIEDSKRKTLVAKNDFYGINLIGKGEIEISVHKILPDGEVVENMFVDSMKVDGEKNYYFQPQTAGRYDIEVKGSNVQVFPRYLIRIDKPNEARRYKVGTKINNYFLENGHNLFEAVSGFDNIRIEDGAFVAEIVDENPVIASKDGMEYEGTKFQMLHVVMKNETSSPLTKVYWKTKGGDYNDNNSFIMPTVANDDQFREYSWPIGYEKGYDGKIITGLKIMPITGHTETGSISVFTIDLFDNIVDDYKLNEKLNLQNVEKIGTIFVDGYDEENEKDSINDEKEDDLIDTDDSKKKNNTTLIVILLSAILLFIIFMYFLKVRKNRYKSMN